MRTAKARKDQPMETDAQKRLREEQDMMRNITSRTALRGVKELATVSSAVACILARVPAAGCTVAAVRRLVRVSSVR